jgi:hypothetical protein
LLDGSTLRIVNSVLAIQSDIGEKPIVESAQAVVLRFFIVPASGCSESSGGGYSNVKASDR